MTMVTASRVNFVVAGAQKSGTRALRKFLANHPDIGVPKPSKPEPHFFDWVLDNRKDRSWAELWQTYHEMFDADALDLVTGDVTPNYIYHPDAVRRIYDYNRRMKIVVILRNPIERAYSQWVMQRESGAESRKFLPALVNERNVLKRLGHHRNFSYLHRGLYDQQVNRLLEIFPKGQCLFIKTERLRDNHKSTLTSVFEFLEVATAHVPPKEVVHHRDYQKMSALSRSILRRYFQLSISRLEDLLGWDCSDWQ
ncbi:MAG: hypothetical protein HKN78_08570 [Sphingomonadaceae bacterium]|nr:hypothetical protein [Sphingomonadaceae bacterium]